MAAGCLRASDPGESEVGGATFFRNLGSFPGLGSHTA